jgi:hypothetical protein
LVGEVEEEGMIWKRWRHTVRERSHVGSNGSRLAASTQLNSGYAAEVVSSGSSSIHRHSRESHLTP